MASSSARRPAASRRRLDRAARLRGRGQRRGSTRWTVTPAARRRSSSSGSAVVSAGPWHAEQRWEGAGYAFVGGEHSVAASCTR